MTLLQILLKHCQETGKGLPEWINWVTQNEGDKEIRFWEYEPTKDLFSQEWDDGHTLAIGCDFYVSALADDHGTPLEITDEVRGLVDMVLDKDAGWVVIETSRISLARIARLVYLSGDPDAWPILYWPLDCDGSNEAEEEKEMEKQKTIEVTQEEYDAFMAGEPIQRKKWEPIQRKKWEPAGVPLGEAYFRVHDHGLIATNGNDCLDWEEKLRDYGNMSREHWQAEEIAKANRITNRIRQYVFEHMREGEERTHTVYRTYDGRRVAPDAAVDTVIGAVLMPKRVAEMLAKDINSGYFEV